MFNGLLEIIEPNNTASNAKLRAPIHEQFARSVEEQTFFDNRTGATFVYDTFAASVKKFGYGGLTHLNQKHLYACFS